MSIALAAPAARTQSVMRLVSLHRKIRVRCVHSSVSLGAVSYEKKRKVLITIRLRCYATSGVGERESRGERSSCGCQEILRVEAAMPRMARSGGVSGMLHRTIARGADHIGGIVSAGLGGWAARERAEAIVTASALNNMSNAQAAPTSRFGF
jgi:hypothetical protein